MSCEARQYGDEMKCGRCGLSWDVNDADRPNCSRAIDRRAIPDRRVTHASIQPGRKVPEPNDPVPYVRVSTTTLPDKLPSDVLTDMVIAYEKVRRDTDDLCDLSDAMRAAYRVLLDRLF
jgi:hypothetical protein